MSGPTARCGTRRRRSETPGTPSTSSAPRRRDRLKHGAAPRLAWNRIPRDPAPPPRRLRPWLASLKSRIQGARARALLAANDEQLRLYHDIGRDILERQTQQGWGAKVIERLAADLSAAFPEMKGFSARNLFYMRQFAEQCPNLHFVQQSAAQLPWFHNLTLLTSLKTPELRDWYAREAIRQSWPRETLKIQIKNQLHLRQGTAVTNVEGREVGRQVLPDAGVTDREEKPVEISVLLGQGR